MMKIYLLVFFIYHCYGIIFYPSGSRQLPIVSISYNVNATSTLNHICSGIVLAVSKKFVAYIGIAAHCIPINETDFSRYEVMYFRANETKRQHYHDFRGLKQIHYQRKWLNGTGAGNFAIIEAEFNSDLGEMRIPYRYDNTTNMMLIRKIIFLCIQ